MGSDGDRDMDKVRGKGVRGYICTASKNSNIGSRCC